MPSASQKRRWQRKAAKQRANVDGTSSVSIEQLVDDIDCLQLDETLPAEVSGEQQNQPQGESTQTIDESHCGKTDAKLKPKKTKKKSAHKKVDQLLREQLKGDIVSLPVNETLSVETSREQPNELMGTSGETECETNSQQKPKKTKRKSARKKVDEPLREQTGQESEQVQPVKKYNHDHLQQQYPEGERVELLHEHNHDHLQQQYPEGEQVELMNEYNYDHQQQQQQYPEGERVEPKNEHIRSQQQPQDEKSQPITPVHTRRQRDQKDTQVGPAENHRQQQQQQQKQQQQQQQQQRVWDERDSCGRNLQVEQWHPHQLLQRHMSLQQQIQLQVQLQQQQRAVRSNDEQTASGSSTPSALKSPSKVKKHNKKRSNTPQEFPAHWSKEQVQQGLKRGELIQEAIRVNPRNYKDSYVSHPDGQSDVYISGLVDRNRALNTDIVAVAVNSKDEWKVLLDELPATIRSSATTVLSPKQNQKSPGKTSVGQPMVSVREFLASEVAAEDDKVLAALKSDVTIAQAYPSWLLRTGKVVYIVECVHTRSCTGHIKPMEDGNRKVALFSPVDHRLPRIRVPMNECPQAFRHRPDDYKKALFIGRITEWSSPGFALGHLARSLGEAGEIEPETEGILIENGISYDEFSSAVLACLPQDDPWTIPTAEFARRRDLRDKCIFTIDPSTARDLDDALHCDDLGNGIFEVGVHIADVSHFVQADTALDIEAQKRATSVYMVQRVIPMLPPLLCERLCSLNPDVDRLTFSVIWKMTAEGEIIDEWFGKSIIRSVVKLSYDHAQGFIEEPTRSWRAKELPRLKEGTSSAQVVECVLNLHKIAVNLRKKRFHDGALRLDQVKLQFTLDSETGLPSGVSTYEQRESNRLVEEFMLLANMAVAHRIYKSYPKLAVLRRHPPPKQKMITELVSVCENFGIQIDVSSAGAIQTCLDRLSTPHNEARLPVLSSLLTRPMQFARYFCTGCLDDEAEFRHYALNVPLYTHFTSPIRRYSDILVHRLLAASIEGATDLGMVSSDVQRCCQVCNQRRQAAKMAQELSGELFLAMFIKEAGILEEGGVVTAVLDRAVDVLILKLGVVKRIYCEKLPLVDFNYSKSCKRRTLTLNWKSDADHPTSVRQCLRVFTAVRCQLMPDDQPLKWTATLMHPEDGKSRQKAS